MSAPAWLPWPGRPSSRPEPSAAGRAAASDSLASSAVPAAAGRFPRLAPAARAGLRLPRAAHALLLLPLLLLGPTSEAAAQTTTCSPAPCIVPTEIYEGERLTFRFHSEYDLNGCNPSFVG